MAGFLLVCIIAPSYAGQLYNYPENHKLDQEIRNIFDSITNPVINYGTASTMTVTQLNVSSITLTGSAVVNKSSTNACGYLIGTVVQSTQAIVSGEFATASATFVNTNTNVTLTPKCITDAMHLQVGGTIHTSTVAGNDAIVTVQRGTTNLGATNGICMGTISATASQRVPCGFSLLDAPASIASLTYSVAIKAGGGSVSWSGTANNSNILLVEEIAQ